MPAISTAVAIATIAAAATSIGTEIYGVVNQPGAPSMKPSPLTAQQNQNQTAAVTGQLPTLQAMTGGSVNPEYAAQWGAGQTGLGNNSQSPGNIQEAINQYFGITAPGSTGFTSSPVGGSSGNPIDYFQKIIQSAQGGGGSALTGSQPTGGGDAYQGLQMV